MRILLLIALFFLPGCDLFSDNPLSDPAKESIDHSLIGTWTWNAESDSGFVHIGTDAAQKNLVITMVEFKNDGRMDTTEFTGHSTKLSSHNFLNLKWTRPQEMEKGYFFMEYRAGTDVLECAFLDTGVFEKAIRAGALKGEVASQGLVRNVLIHAAQEDLRKFVMQNLKSLPTNTFKLKKLALSSDSPQTLDNSLFYSDQEVTIRGTWKASGSFPYPYIARSNATHIRCNRASMSCVESQAQICRSRGGQPGSSPFMAAYTIEYAIEKWSRELITARRISPRGSPINTLLQIKPSMGTVRMAWKDQPKNDAYFLPSEQQFEIAAKPPFLHVN